uniref:Uncharacterized protein n=1 Tax=Rhizophora mucronata TaxID=61149 RepID=A0A2P2PFZ4_RHIMU
MYCMDSNGCMTNPHKWNYIISTWYD